MDIQKLLKEKKKMSLGKEQTLKLLKQGKLAEIFISANFPEKESIKQLAKMSDTKVNIIKQTNEELGALCKKPFQIAIAGLEKE